MQCPAAILHAIELQMGAPMLDEAVDLLTVAAATRQHVLKCTTLAAARLYQFRSQICSFLGELFALG